jgi:putative ABC transport system permease protein
MKPICTRWMRLRGLFRKEQLDRELDAEIASHLEMHIATHEIGIRVALGAPGTDILSMVFAKSLPIIVAGVAIGLLASYASSQFLASELSGVSISDPSTYGVVTFIVVAVGLLACYLPARRTTRVDPLITLRYE